MLAHRLTEDPTARVPLPEAGGEAERPLVALTGAATALENTRLDWACRTQPRKRLNGRRVDWARGRALGGSSAINRCLHVRGNRGDYDGWAQRGCTGWDDDSVLPHVRRAEANARFRDRWHGTDGPLSVEDGPSRGPLHEVHLAAGRSIGIPFNPDPNGATQEGCTVIQHTLRGGRRCSAATAYPDPLRDRPNLTVATGAIVTGLWTEGRRIRGVAWIAGGRSVRRAAAGEVIPAAGAIASPHRLMLSGIGPADHLTDHGIPVVADLPAVGRT